MEQKSLSKVQAVLFIVGAFFVAVIISGLIAQSMASDLYANGVRTIALLLWVISIGFIWQKTKA